MISGIESVLDGKNIEYHIKQFRFRADLSDRVAEHKRSLSMERNHMYYR